MTRHRIIVKLIVKATGAVLLVLPAGSCVLIPFEGRALGWWSGARC